MELTQSTSIFMMPFFFDNKEKIFTPGEESIWKKCTVSLDKGKLYPHIQKVLQSSGDTSDIGYRLYSLSESVMAENIKKVLARKMKITVKGDDGMNRDIFFRLGQAEISGKEETFFSPKLLICPNSRTGMLIFSCILEKKHQTMEDLISLNYAIFKTYPEGSSQNHDIYIARGEKVCMDEEAKKNAAERAQKVADLMQKVFDTTESWNMSMLTQRLMSEVTGHSRFDPFRLHVFTYLQLTQDKCSPRVLTDFHRILKLQNYNYQVSVTGGTPVPYRNTFNNIYIGSTVEGGGIMTFIPKKEQDKEGNSFLRDFRKSSLSQVYLWIYIMVQMQRYTLINIERNLTEYDFNNENTKDSRANLREFVTLMTKNKINTYFTDVSTHTHHNLFYSLCCQNLSIKAISETVEQKIFALKEHLDLLIDEEELNLAAIQNEISERRETSMQIITVIGAVIALFSVFNDAFGMLDGDHFMLYDSCTAPWLRNLSVTGVIIGVALIAAAWAINFFKKNK